MKLQRNQCIFKLLFITLKTTIFCKFHDKKDAQFVELTVQDEIVAVRLYIVR